MVDINTKSTGRFADGTKVVGIWYRSQGARRQVAVVGSGIVLKM